MPFGLRITTSSIEPNRKRGRKATCTIYTQMSHQIEPVSGLFSSGQFLKSWSLFNFDLDQLVGFPDTSVQQTVVSVEQPSTTTLPEKKATQPKDGDCVEVCGSNDCSYLYALPGVSDGGLTLTEKVAKDILGDSDDYALQNVSWKPAPDSNCEEKKTLKKRQWYPNYGPSEYAPQDPYNYEYGGAYPYSEPEPEPVYNPYQFEKDYSEFKAPQSNSQNYKSAAAPPPVEKSVKITNSNTGNLEDAAPSEIAAAPKIANAALSDPPRRTVGPGTGPKKSLNKGTTRRYPVAADVTTNRPATTDQSSQTESYSTNPNISLTSNRSPAEGNDGTTAPEKPDDEPEPTPGVLSESRLTVASPVIADDPAAPRMRKIEHPDGSIEYSFGVISGEYNVYNEGEPVIKKPGRRHKSVISGLKQSISMDDDNSGRSGWTRLAKRGVAPDNKPNAKKFNRGGPSDKGAAFLRGPTSRKQAAPQPQAPPPQPQKPVEPEPGSEEKKAKEAAEAAQALAEADDKAEQAIQDYQRLEADRTRRLSLKAFYRGIDKQADQIDLKRDKEAENQIYTESERMAAENAQKRREDRARQQKEEKAKLEGKEKDNKEDIVA
ncbi:hypothetical protein DFH27DRAFT_27516 [Peziza echinospora]|nr:hypothetical protein DFH27DRAFT_27516 [Peziza echinospora]